MSKRLNLFPTPLIIDQLEGSDALNAELEAAILERMNAESGIKRSNVGGWHSNTDLLKWGGPLRAVRLVAGPEIPTMDGDEACSLRTSPE